ncbi:phosphodiesterase/alkaline phosphatase D-like protein, partial [Reticulomyxa filosa]
KKKKSANSRFAWKKESKSALLKFLHADNATDVRYKREGIYHYHSMVVSLDASKKRRIYHFKENEILDNERQTNHTETFNDNDNDNDVNNVYWNENKNEYFHIDIYLFDSRYFLKNDTTYPLLGPDQWKWFTHRIQSRAHIADVNVFVSGIQVLSNYRGYVGEQWFFLLLLFLDFKNNNNKNNKKIYMYIHIFIILLFLLLLLLYVVVVVVIIKRSRYSRQERQKLLNVLSLVNNPIVISGDVHFGEMQKVRLSCLNNTQQTNEVFEVTSSGMTHSVQDFPYLFFQLPFRLWHVFDPDGYSIGIESSFNFGEIEILFSKQQDTPHQLLLKVFNQQGQVSLLQSILVPHKKNTFDPKASLLLQSSDIPPCARLLKTMESGEKDFTFSFNAMSFRRDKHKKKTE